jgi:hypothetical protein
LVHQLEMPRKNTIACHHLVLIKRQNNVSNYKYLIIKKRRIFNDASFFLR